MPELPEVETVRRGLQPVMEGFKIVGAEARRKDLRFPFQKDFVARLIGQTVTGLGRRAKYLMAALESGDVLLMHLGMSGSFRVVSDAGRPGISDPGSELIEMAIRASIKVTPIPGANVLQRTALSIVHFCAGSRLEPRKMKLTFPRLSHSRFCPHRPCLKGRRPMPRTLLWSGKSANCEKFVFFISSSISAAS